MYNLAQKGHSSKKKRVGFAKKYFRKRMKAINAIIHFKPIDLTADRIHELRLEIKKLKALFELISYTTNKFPRRKYFKPLKTLFENAGSIRCVQVEHELLKKYIPDERDKYLHHLSNVEIENGEKLAVLFQSKIFSKVKNIKKEIMPFLQAVSATNVNIFLKKEAKKIVSLTEKKIFSDRKLHVIRKKLKNFYFIAGSAYADIVIPDPWNKLLELLGDWHDSQVAIEHLRKAIYSSSYPQTEIDLLDRIKQELIVNREKLFDQITATYALIQSKENRIRLPRSSRVVDGHADS